MRRAGWYADRVSVLPGQSARLLVSTTERSYRVLGYRIGWYGGAGARLVYASGWLTGVRQPAPRVTCQTRSIVTGWTPSLSVRTAGWPPGDYLFRLTGAAGSAGYVPLTVRTPDNRGRLVLLDAVTTWQAYNGWGGYDLYWGSDHRLGSRSYAVSFDRPYAQGNGAGQFLAYERPVVALAERLGLDLGYATSIDLQRDAHLLDGARALISPAHDEYYSPAMRAVLTRARDRGTNLGFLGANAVFRRIRFAATPLGAFRWEICYKNAALDPLSHVRGRARMARTSPRTMARAALRSLTNSPEITSNWPDRPRADPESRLTGQVSGCSPVHAAMVIADPSSWIFAGTEVRRGDRLPALLGMEVDRVDLSSPTPRPLQVLAHSPVTCGRRHGYSDLSYYTTTSGAGVVDVGTINWEAALLASITTDPGRYHEQRVVVAATTNILRAFAAGPAGRAHPAYDNVAAVLRPARLLATGCRRSTCRPTVAMTVTGLPVLGEEGKPLRRRPSR